LGPLFLKKEKGFKKNLKIDRGSGTSMKDARREAAHNLWLYA
jgi:hypothetical protein